MNCFFTGLGSMGLPIAVGLRDAGLNLSCWDMSEAAREQARTHRLSVARPRAADAFDIVATCLPDGKAVRALLASAETAVLDHSASGGAFLDFSTIGAEDSDRIAELLASRRIAYVDCTVARTTDHAWRKELICMVGADPAAFDRLAPSLRGLGEVFHCGGPGSGVRMKLVNNALSLSLLELTCEVLTVGEKVGLARDIMLKVMSQTAAGRGHLGSTLPAKVWKGDLTPGFSVALAAKDLGLARDLAGSTGSQVRMIEAALDRYRLAAAAGLAHSDHTALYTLGRATQD